ncbi:hypothetical protein KEM48_014399 [Puccinia striiformis f. sp. tritici PST-130]|nr:hypothetical protein KEM48_014399 [Puccinia striiformis f. sp. tritici PST-130]
MNPLSSRITLFAITALLLSLCTSASKKRKCRGTLNSDAYGNSWEKANVVWKSPKHQKEGVVEATIHGRIDIPTNDGSTIQSHVCYATVKVNITDCSMVLGKNATADQGWDLQLTDGFLVMDESVTNHRYTETRIHGIGTKLLPFDPIVQKTSTWKCLNPNPSKPRVYPQMLE